MQAVSNTLGTSRERGLKRVPLDGPPTCCSLAIEDSQDWGLLRTRMTAFVVFVFPGMTVILEVNADQRCRGFLCHQVRRVQQVRSCGELSREPCSDGLEPQTFLHPIIVRLTTVSSTMPLFGCQAAHRRPVDSERALSQQFTATSLCPIIFILPDMNISSTCAVLRRWRQPLRLVLQCFAA